MQRIATYFRSGDRVLVAVSGGADSMALLHALDEQKEALGIELTVAHFNHGLRAGAGRDQAFVGAVARKLGIPFVTAVCARKPPVHGSLEAFARRERYLFLRRAATRVHADVCVTAHTLDDQAETVLMRLIRGTGLAGLQSILPTGVINGLKVVRPFLSVTRKEVEAFLKKKKIRWVEDPTNRSSRFTRNMIRHDLVPYIERRFSPDIKHALARLAMTAAEDYRFIENEASRFLDKEAVPGPLVYRIPLGRFVRLPTALRRAVLRKAVQQIKGDLNIFTMAHIDAMDALAGTGKAGASLSLPAGFVCCKNVHLILEIKRSRV